MNKARIVSMVHVRGFPRSCEDERRSLPVVLSAMVEVAEEAEQAVP